MVEARACHIAVVLPNGRVAVMGGSGDGRLGDLESAEIFDPSTGQFQATGDPSCPSSFRMPFLHSEFRVGYSKFSWCFLCALVVCSSNATLQLLFLALLRFCADFPGKVLAVRSSPWIAPRQDRRIFRASSSTSSESGPQ